MWVHAPFAVQRAAADRLLGLVAESPVRVREALPVQRVLDSLLLLYYYEEPEGEMPSFDSASAVNSNVSNARASVSTNLEAVILSPESESFDDSNLIDEMEGDSGGAGESLSESGDSGTPPGDKDAFALFVFQNRFKAQQAKLNSVRLAEEELAEIRSKMFKILHMLIVYGSDGVSSAGLRALVDHALVTTCGRSKAEALHLVLRIMSVPAEEAEAKVPRLFTAFSKCNCLQAVLSLLKHKVAKVRLFTFLLLCKLIYLSCIYSLPDNMRRHLHQPPAAHSSSPVLPEGGSVSAPEGFAGAGDGAAAAASASTAPAAAGADPAPPGGAPAGERERTRTMGGSIPTPSVPPPPPAPEELYFLDVVGIPVASLGDLMLYVIDTLCEQIRLDVKEATDQCSTHVRLQCRTIAQALQSTLLGDSCDYLVFDVDQLSHHLPGRAAPAAAPEGGGGGGRDDMPETTDTPSSFDSYPAAAERAVSPVPAVPVSLNMLAPGMTPERVKNELVDPLGMRRAPEGTLLNTPVDTRRFDFSGDSKGKKSTRRPSATTTLPPAPDQSPPPSASRGGSMRESRAEGLLMSSSVVCAPMLFSVILSMVRFEGLQVSLGLSVLVNLKTTIVQNDHNADAILATSHWQFWILQLIVSERKRLAKLETKFHEASSRQSQSSEPPLSSPSASASRPLAGSKEEQRAMEKSAALIDTCMRMICDLQLIAFRLGRVKCSPALYSPLKAYPQRISGMDVLRDIGRGRRQLGATVLRDTMSFFRMYGELGELDAQQSGFDLLLQTLFSLQLEKTLQESKTKASAFNTDDSYAAKVATLSKWLIGAIVFDFISVPITQGKEWKGTEKAAAATPPPRPPSVRRRLLSTSFDCRSSDSSEHTSDSLHSILMDGVYDKDDNASPSQGHGRCLPHMFDNIAPANDRSEIDSPLSPNATKSDTKAAQARTDTEVKDLMGGRVEQTWRLVSGLLTMYGPLNNASAWSVVGMKLKAVGQLGLLTGLSALSQISDGIDQIMPGAMVVNTSSGGGQSSGPVNVPGAGNVFRISGTPSKVAKLESPLMSTAYSVCWLLTRALESLYLVGSDNSSNHAISLEALTKLRSLLNGLRSMGAEFVEFESRNIVSRICSGLSTSSLPVVSDWMKCGLEYLCELLMSQRTYFADLLILELGLPSIEKGSSQDHLVQSAERERERVHSNSEGDSGEPMPAAVRLVSICLMTAAPGTPSCEVVLAVVKASLKLPADADAMLTWLVWIESISSISDEIDRMEDELVLARLNDIGLHKHTQEIRRDLGLVQAASQKVAAETMLLAESSLQGLFKQQTDRIAMVLKNIDKQYRSNTHKWSRIVSELANERGPWGCAAEDQSTVLWMMDPATTNDFRRPRLKRNEHGSAHANSSFITRGAFSNGAPAAAAAAAAAAAPVAEKGGGGLAHGLWRDLVKYQRKDIPPPGYEGEGDNPNALITSDQQAEDGDGLEEAAAAAPAVGDISAAVESGAGAEAEKHIFKEECEIITSMVNSSAGGTIGILEVYKSRIVFMKTVDFDYGSVGQKLGNTDFLWACQNFPSSAWSCSHIVNIYQRSYQLRYVAIEIFFTNRRSLFINLHSADKAELLLTTIRRKVRPQHISPYFGRTPKIIINRFALPGAQNPISVTEAWQCREISNYEYLTFLNLIAGRTCNDLGQYPVFPWVLADYTSKKLDLRNPDTFRDFKYSMGAQKEEQRLQFIEKYYDLKANYDADQAYAKRNNLQSVDSLPPFHYGSHYSCMGFVLWYLVRHEPFTSLGVWLQDGKFDKADRLFDSIEAAWRGCTTNQSDVKELIPEFFYQSDFLDNYNNVDLGTTQMGKQIGPVKLPRWAKNSQDFIHQHREALESDHVSMNLHHWIDLIFGYKQRPPHMGGNQAAVDSVNIYFHLTYAGAVDLDQLKESDPYLYSQTVRQIDNFGQTPTQLFDKPHVQRLPFDKCDIIWPIASVVRGVDTVAKGQPALQKPRKVICFKLHKISDFPLVFIGEAGALERLVTVDSSRVVGWHLWQVRQPDVVPPYQIKVDPQALRISQGLTAATPFSLFPTSYQTANRERRIGAPFAPPQLFSPLHLLQAPALYAANKRLFCQEETDRLNVKAMAAASPEPPGPRSTRDRSGSSASVSSRASNKPEGKLSRGISNASSKNTPGSRAAPSYDPKRYSTVGGDSVLMSPSKPRVDERLSSALFAFLPSSNLIFSCGHWDNSFKVSLADTGRLIQSISHHRDVVTCLTLCSEYGSTWLITGSRDCTVMVWEVSEDKALPLSVSPLYILYGHDDAVTCVTVNLELDVIVSGSDDGSIIIHGLRDGGNYIRSIFLFDSVSSPVHQAADADGTQGDHSKRKTENRTDILRRVTWVGVSREGYVVSYSSQDATLCTHTLNGKFVVRREAGEHLHAFLLSEDGKVILTGGDRSLLVMRWVHNLELANDGLRKGFEAVLDGSNAEDAQAPMSSPIRSLYLTKKERHLLVGLENGELRVMTQVRLEFYRYLFFVFNFYTDLNSFFDTFVGF
jgi:hypothetical protein